MTGAVVSIRDHALSRPALAYLARMAPGSRPTQTTALRRIAGRLGADWRTLRWQELDRVTTSAIRAWAAESFAPATTNRMLAALRGVLKECWRAGLMSTDSYQRAVDLPSVKQQRLPAGRSVGRQEMIGLFDALLDVENGRRNRAILAVLVGCGLRRAELVALDCSDLDPGSGELTVRGGKGAKDRTVWLGPSALSPVLDWTRGRSGPMFGVSTATVYSIVREAAERAGLPRTTPHDLRRTFVTNLLDQGVDIATVQQMAGHADIQTTSRYDRRGEKAKQAAAALLEIPKMTRSEREERAVVLEYARQIQEQAPDADRDECLRIAEKWLREERLPAPVFDTRGTGAPS